MSSSLNTDKFKLIGGDLSFDFVNTVHSWNETAGSSSGTRHNRRYAVSADKFASYADLIAWSVKASLFSESRGKKLLQLAEKQAPGETGKIVKRALVLRHSIYHLFVSAIERQKPEAGDLEILNRELWIARRHQKLESAENGFAFEWIDAGGELDSMLWSVSEAAAKMLSEGDLTRFGQCIENDCRWLFLDTSRNHSRQWCNMKECGNRAKVNRFRQRHQQKA